MSRIQQDQFVDDDEDECCPLCVEEFDLSDRNFRPCPCGYQVRPLEPSSMAPGRHS
jgi:CCR4-NOT transcription complex subunit 4